MLLGISPELFLKKCGFAFFGQILWVVSLLFFKINTNNSIYPPKNGQFHDSLLASPFPLFWGMAWYGPHTQLPRVQAILDGVGQNMGPLPIGPNWASPILRQTHICGRIIFPAEAIGRSVRCMRWGSSMDIMCHSPSGIWTPIVSLSFPLNERPEQEQPKLLNRVRNGKGFCLPPPPPHARINASIKMVYPKHLQNSKGVSISG